jgi:formate dehydrogenase iron-sulfur subunit
VVDPRSLDDYLAHGGGAGLARARQMSAAEIVQEVTDSGLRGRGGAAFPTGIKWNTVLNTPADQKYIVCNADEGDSGTFADRMLMEGDPFSLFEGMQVRTQSPRLAELRRNVMELYISDHPLDCLTCAANGDCELQIA